MKKPEVIKIVAYFVVDDQDIYRKMKCKYQPKIGKWKKMPTMFV
jgi:hypothetical protein